METAYQNNFTTNCGLMQRSLSIHSTTAGLIQHRGARRPTSPPLTFTIPSRPNIPSFGFAREIGRFTFGQQSATQTGSRMLGRQVGFSVCISTLRPSHTDHPFIRRCSIHCHNRSKAASPCSTKRYETIKETTANQERRYQARDPSCSAASDRWGTNCY